MLMLVIFNVINYAYADIDLCTNIVFLYCNYHDGDHQGSVFAMLKMFLADQTDSMLLSFMH